MVETKADGQVTELIVPASSAQGLRFDLNIEGAQLELENGIQFPVKKGPVPLSAGTQDFVLTAPEFSPKDWSQKIPSSQFVAPDISAFTTANILRVTYLGFAG